MEIEVASINFPDRTRAQLPPVEADEAGRTYYVKSGGVARMAFAALATAAANPRVALRGFRAALRLGDWDLKARVFALFYLAEALLVGRWMRSRSLAHLHVHFGGAVATVGMLTAQAWRVPWSLTLHGPDEFFDEETFFLRRKIESAAFVVCISDFCRSQVMRIAPGIPVERLHVVRLGVDCAALVPAGALRSAPGAPGHAEPEANGPLRLVCTGRLVAAKGHRILLEAIAPLIASGLKIDCTLIGDGPERKTLEALCDQLGIGRHVRFLGAQAHAETLKLVGQADIFVLASFAEGLPVALMEAMALGIPCISTTIAAIPELIYHERNGLLVPPANTQALRDALGQLAGDSQLRLRLGGQGRSTVQRSYNLATNLDLLAEMWSQRLAALR